MKTHRIYFISLVVSIVLLFVLPTKFIVSDLGNTVLTITTFLFGLIAGFYIVVTITDYNSIKTILANETGTIISLYHHVVVYDSKKGEELRELIDEYVIRGFDREIIDYPREVSLEYSKIINFISRLSPDKANLSHVHQNITQFLGQFITAHQQLTVLGTKTLSRFQWFVLLVLGSLVTVSLYGLRTGAVFFDIVAVLVSGSIVLILLTIRDLDLYIWNEKTFGFEIFENVFKEIGKLLYYPSYSLRNNRIVPIEKEYRVGIHVKDYPKSIEKTIEIRKK